MAGYRRSRANLGIWLGEKTAPYVAPWLLMAGAMPVAVGLHFFVGSDPTWMAVLGGIFTCMTYGTWFTWKSRKPETRATVTLLTAALLTWVIFASTGTPWSGNLLKSWVIGGFCGSAFWMIRHAGTVAGHDRDRVETAGQGWLEKKVSAFKGSRTDPSSVKETADELRWRTGLDAPTTASDAQHAREQIAAVAGVGADQVKVLKVKGDESKVDVVLTRAQDNSRPLTYRGPSAPGQSCAAAPLYLGRRTDGSDIEWWMPGDPYLEQPRNVAHSKTTGVTGAGKTDTICTAILDLRWRTDIVPVVGDPAKFQQGFGDIEECLAVVAKTPAQVKQLISNLAGPVVEYRADLLGRLVRSDGETGYKQWEPECYTRHGIPFVFVDIEEAADVIMEMDEEMYQAVRKLRSTGVKLNISMQTMPHDDIPRKVRGQFSESLAHGQNEYQDAKYALHGDTLEAGADPAKWGPDSPGSHYAEVTGTDKTHWPIDGRAVCMSPAQRRMSLEGSRQFWAETDPGTYDRLSFGLEAAGQEDMDDDEEEMDMAVGGEELNGRAAYEGVEGADPNVPLKPPPAGLNFLFKEPEEKIRLTTEEARRRLMNRLDVLARGGHLDITYDDVADIPGEVGRSSGWVYENLGLLVAAGVLKEYKPPKGKTIYTIIRQFPDPSES